MYATFYTYFYMRRREKFSHNPIIKLSGTLRATFSTNEYRSGSDLSAGETFQPTVRTRYFEHEEAFIGLLIVRGSSQKEPRVIKSLNQAPCHPRIYNSFHGFDHCKFPICMPCTRYTEEDSGFFPHLEFYLTFIRHAAGRRNVWTPIQCTSRPRAGRKQRTQRSRSSLLSYRQE